jgi:hypothetical protein
MGFNNTIEVGSVVASHRYMAGANESYFNVQFGRTSTRAGGFTHKHTQ